MCGRSYDRVGVLISERLTTTLPHKKNQNRRGRRPKKMQSVMWRQATTKRTPRCKAIRGRLWLWCISDRPFLRRLKRRSDWHGCRSGWRHNQRLCLSAGLFPYKWRWRTYSFLFPVLLPPRVLAAGTDESSISMFFPEQLLPRLQFPDCRRETAPHRSTQ